MNPLNVLVPVIAATLFVSTAVSGWQLLNANRKLGAVQQSLDTCTGRLKELNNAHRERDRIDGQNRALPDDQLFDGLLR